MPIPVSHASWESGWLGFLESYWTLDGVLCAFAVAELLLAALVVTDGRHIRCQITDAHRTTRRET